MRTATSGAEIGAQQHILDIVEHGAVELALGDEVCDRRPERTGGSLQSAGQPLSHQLSFGVSSVFTHEGDVLAVSSRKRKSRQLLDVPELTAGKSRRECSSANGLMLIIDKPAGSAGASRTQGRSQSGSSFDALRFGLPRPPVLAHRLDKDTSGCLVLGGTARRPPRSACCSSTARSQRPIGPWSRAALPRMKAASTCRSAG
jgi:hypothetical protein